MGYNALARMQDINRATYGVEHSVRIPDLPHATRQFGRDALAFIREQCEDLKFDTTDEQRIALADSDGRSASPNTIPYNMERDLDRLSFEVAIGRFLESGSREDAFDVYYCYCEIFKPFGSGYDTTGVLLEMLSEHEANASSLLMKHRDHYSHSVYVFLIGLAMYGNHPAVRAAYNAKYGLEEGPQAACHFLEYWGLTSLFHDIGYPFEIAHQQMKAYVCNLFGETADGGFAPYVSYRNMESFAHTQLGDLDELYARIISERLAERYLEHAGSNEQAFRPELLAVLKDRAVHEDSATLDYLFMDHAYFSGLVLARSYLDRHPEIDEYDALPSPLLDGLCAIILHNSLFKFTIRGLLGTREPLSLHDGQPLSYLLMLCDELQCWDRASYGHANRNSIYPFDFDMEFADGSMRWTYIFDSTFETEAREASAFRNVCADGYTTKKGVVRAGRSKFVDDIDGIVRLSDVLPAFESDTTKPDPSGVIAATLEPKCKKTGHYVSDSNYLNLYDFALALNGRYCGAETEDEMVRAFEEGLSLEYKLSNIAQAKGFAAHLERIGCFYTDRPVEYERLIDFTPRELATISEDEHNRWNAEKLAMGWDFGDGHVGKLNGRNDNAMRERTRLHHDLVAFKALSDEEIEKDAEPMRKMLELIHRFEGLAIYRM